ncbi:MAG: hypothetical protein Q7R83_01695 [bacterium]|nr:hypothetical protein [bacterium]
MNFETGRLSGQRPGPERVPQRLPVSKFPESRERHLLRLRTLKLKAMELARGHADVRAGLPRLEAEIEKTRAEAKKGMGEMDAAETALFADIQRILSPAREALMAEERKKDTQGLWQELDQGWQDLTEPQTDAMTVESAEPQAFDQAQRGWEAISRGNPAHISEALSPVRKRMEQAARANAGRAKREMPPVAPIPVEVAMPALKEAAVSELVYFEEHPAGPELDSAEMRVADSVAAAGIMQEIRNNRLFKPLMKTLAGVATFFALALPVKQFQEQGTAQATEMKLQEETDRKIEALKRPGVQQQLAMRFEQELERMDPARVEARGVKGDPSWSPEQMQTYQSLSDLKSKFRYLHQNDKAALEALDNPELLVASYQKMVKLALYEFPHTNLFRQVTRDAVNAAIDALPKMENRARATELYAQLKQDIMQVQGARPAYDLEYSLLAQLPDGHPLKGVIGRSHMMKPGFSESIFRVNKNNKLIFDQQQGTIGIFRATDGKLIRLDTHPANGGRPDAVPYGQGDVHQHVRTPDGTFRLGQVETAVSPYWQNAWLPNGTVLVPSADGVNIDYVDKDGHAHRLTGEDGEFMGQKPFRQRGGSSLFRSATVVVDGKAIPPAAFSAEEIKKLFRYDGTSSVIGEWEWNEFGTRAFRIYNGQERTSLLVHTNPVDSAEELPLASSHGCVRVKPEAIDDMLDLLPADAELIIRSGVKAF